VKPARLNERKGSIGKGEKPRLGNVFAELARGLDISCKKSSGKEDA